MVFVITYLIIGVLVSLGFGYYIFIVEGEDRLTLSDFLSLFVMIIIWPVLMIAFLGMTFEKYGETTIIDLSKFRKTEEDSE